MLSNSHSGIIFNVTDNKAYLTIFDMTRDGRLSMYFTQVNCFSSKI